MAISNTFATIPGIISPILTGHIIRDKTKSEWNIVFWISAIIGLIGAIFYGVFGSGETQPWAYSATTKSAEVEEIKEKSYIFKNNEINPLNNKSDRIGHTNTTYDTIEN